MLEPFSWGVIAVGAWNLAILSPDGIRRRLFKLEDSAAIQLELMVDRPGQFRVSHGGLIVVPTPMLLEVATQVATNASLKEACDLARLALESLPETPVSAVGVNVRYRFSEVPDNIIDSVRRIDQPLADAGFRVKGNYGDAGVATRTGCDKHAGELLREWRLVRVYPHRDSTAVGELIKWLERPKSSSKCRKANESDRANEF